jgi:hypothetical protein
MGSNTLFLILIPILLIVFIIIATTFLIAVLIEAIRDYRKLKDIKKKDGGGLNE